MKQKLETGIREWLQRYSVEWSMPLEQVALVISIDEIRNRLQSYPKVHAALSSSSIDTQLFAEAVRECWALSDRFVSIRFNRFINKPGGAATTIKGLIRDFPDEDKKAAERINNSLAEIVDLGYRDPSGNRDWAGAALLASVILTSVYPKRFVDFRQNRWSELADVFGYQKPTSSVSYGDRLIWAGQFAIDISRTEIYQAYWPEGEPLWVIAGISWKGTSQDKPAQEPIDTDILSFPEGTEKRRLHLLRERNQTVVSLAKSQLAATDALLRCQVCGFSFVETYGEIGRGFIEAHHRQPVAELKSGSRTSVDDIALLCANCHRMIHRADRTLTLDVLGQRLRSRKNAG